MLPNGNVFVGWGAEPYVSEFTADGRLVFDAQLAPDYVSYRAFRWAWDGVGAGTPAVARSRAGRDFEVYVSWNGDTQVAHWVLHAGTDLTRPVPVARVPRTGFETGMRVPDTYTQLRLVGMDARGRALGQSALVSL